MQKGKGKRAQVTIFIIIAILLVAGIAGFFFIKARGNSQNNNIPMEIKPIYDYVQECITETGYNAVYDLADRGGYYYLPNETTAYGIPYYLNQKITIPTNQELEQQISYYLEDNLIYCASEFSNFPEYNITQGKVFVETKIGAEILTINVKWPTSIAYRTTNYRIEEFKDNILPVRINLLYDLAKKLVVLFNNDRLNLCISCMQDLNYRYNVSISATEVGNKTIIFKIVDLQRLIPYKLQFAVK